VLRAGWGTPNETALWLLDGDFYQDHRHYDQGAIALYALGVPLSLNWGSLYQPQTPGAYLQSTVLPESQLGIPWNQDGVPLDTGAVWQTSRLQSFVALPNGGYVQASYTAADGTTWLRSIYTVQTDLGAPVIVFRDSFTGTAADAAKVFSINLMAEGAVATPAGMIDPGVRNFNEGNSLPSAGQVFTLQPGVNSFGFTGQEAVSWNLYSITDRPQQALLGNWGHDWNPEQEKAQYAAANAGETFQENQDILRLRSNGSFTVALLPYRKGDAASPQVLTNGGAVTVLSGAAKTVVGTDYYTYQDDRKSIVAALGPAPVEANGIRISGGAAEVVVDQQLVTITLSGDPGTRIISLPVSVPGGSSLRLDYQGGSPLTVTFPYGQVLIA
jgi:hypothetical protein